MRWAWARYRARGCSRLACRSRVSRAELNKLRVPPDASVNLALAGPVRDQQLERVDQARTRAVEVRGPVQHHHLPGARGVDGPAERGGLALRPCPIEPAGRHDQQLRLRRRDLT